LWPTKKTEIARKTWAALLPLEFSSGEKHYQREAAHDETPERIFERRWALAVLDRVVEKLRNEFVHHGRPEHFERLKVFLLGRADTSYAALAREMNTSEGALKVAIHRLRKRYRELFRQEIADGRIPPNWSPNSAFWLPRWREGSRSEAPVPNLIATWTYYAHAADLPEFPALSMDYSP
jgi:hypothetical protein